MANPQNKGLLILGILGIAAAVVATSSNNSTTTSNTLTVDKKRAILINWIGSTNDSPATKQRITGLFKNTLSNQEISDIYEYKTLYIDTGNKLPSNTSLFKRLSAISVTYNIFN